MAGKSYVVSGATMKCSYGEKETVLKVDESMSVNASFSGLLQIPEDAAKKDINIPDFGTCKAPGEKLCRTKWELADKWDNTAPSFIGNGKNVQTDNSILLCLSCKGVITIDFHGQNSELFLYILDKNAEDITDEEYAFLAYMFLYVLNTEEKNEFVRGLYDHEKDQYVNPAGMFLLNLFSTEAWVDKKSSSSWNLNEEKHNKIMAAALAYQALDNMGSKKGFQNYILLDTVGKEMKSCVGEYGASGPLFELSDGPDESYIIKLQQSDGYATFNEKEYSISKTLYKDDTDLSKFEFVGDPNDAVKSFLGDNMSDEMKGAIADAFSSSIFESIKSTGKEVIVSVGGTIFGIVLSIPEAMMEYEKNEQARTKDNILGAADIFGLYLVEVSGGGKQNTYSVAPTQYTVDKVQAYNDWGKAYAGDNFEPIEPEDTLGFSDKMLKAYNNINEHSGLSERISVEMGETK